LQSFLFIGLLMHELILLIDKLSLKRVVKGWVFVADAHALVLLMSVLRGRSTRRCILTLGGEWKEGRLVVVVAHSRNRQVLQS
jgi:hypothetical protein